MSLRLLLRERRIALGWSTSEVAERARAREPNLKGFHGPSISYWETPTSGRSPSAEQLLVWAAVLGFEVVLNPAKAA